MMPTSTQPNRRDCLTVPTAVISGSRSLSRQPLPTSSTSRLEPNHDHPLSRSARLPILIFPTIFGRPRVRARVLSNARERRASTIGFVVMIGVDAVQHPRLRNPGEPATKWPTARAPNRFACAYLLSLSLSRSLFLCHCLFSSTTSRILHHFHFYLLYSPPMRSLPLFASPLHFPSSCYTTLCFFLSLSFATNTSSPTYFPLSLFLSISRQRFIGPQVPIWSSPFYLSLFVNPPRYP